MSEAGPQRTNFVFILLTPSLRKPSELRHKLMLYYYANHILREIFFQHCTTFQLLISSGEHKPFHSLFKTVKYVLQNHIPGDL